MPEYEVSLTFSNERETTIYFILEPWGEIYPMEPLAKFTVCFRSSIALSSPRTVEVAYGMDQITAYAWEGCTATLFQNGEEIGAGAAPGFCVPQGLEVLKTIGFFRDTINDVSSGEK